MNEIHPGLVLLREIAPSENVRRGIVRELCSCALGQPVKISHVRWALGNYQIKVINEPLLQRIADFVNQI